MSDRLAYARKRLDEALEHVGVGEEIFNRDAQQMPRQPHIVAARIRVYEKMLEDDKVRMSDIDRLLGLGTDAVSNTLRTASRVPVIDDDRAWQIVEEAMAATGATKHDFRYRTGNLVARDAAVTLMRERQPDGARLSLKRITYMMFHGSRHSIVLDSLKRHEARQKGYNPSCPKLTAPGSAKLQSCVRA